MEPNSIMEQDYKTAIKILSDDSNDWKAICFRIAQDHPSVFISVFDTDELKKVQLDEALKRHVEVNGGYPYAKIQAIKKCRELTGFGLKESKEYVEKLFG